MFLTDKYENSSPDWRDFLFIFAILGTLQPYGFDVGASDIGMVLKGLDYGVEGMRVGGQVQ